MPRRRKVTFSGSLFKLARDQHQAGISTGVDVARSETNSAQEQLRLIRAQVAAQQADLRLKRVVEHSSHSKIRSRYRTFRAKC